MTTRQTVDSREADALLATARALVARELIDFEVEQSTVGEVTLYPHQRRAVSRVRALLRVAGGALVADATGLGKTFVALAVAARVERTLIVSPASLLDTWRRAAVRARVDCDFISMERLSRGTPKPVIDPDLVVVDEAHHFRNTRTRRYAAVAELCYRSWVLLLSATPLQNRRDDLVAQLALFLGDAASTGTDDDLARLIVRQRAADATLPLPAIQGPRRITLPVDDDLLDYLLAVPAPLPGSDEGEAGALLTYTLLRQWASSRAALVGALRRRLGKAVALTTSLEMGRWPGRDELLAWSCGSEALQLALPELLAPLGVPPPTELESLLIAVRAHAHALRALLTRLRQTTDPDPYRAAALDAICREHTGARIIAFSQYAETVQALSRLLMPFRAGVAELTAHAGRVVGGRISRREILAQFAPSVERPSPREAERISLLITTDVLSEGLDLQRASVIVHLDLPWNPARLEQRVGRVRRLGSAHDEVFVYVIAPPASSERVLRVESRLRAKLNIASQVVGLHAPLIVEAAAANLAAPPELASEILGVLEGWRDPARAASAGNEVPLFAGALAPDDGLLVLLGGADGQLLLGSSGAGALVFDTSVVARVVAMCDGSAVVPTVAERARAMAAIGNWTLHAAACGRLAMSSPAGARLRARIALRITELLSSAPRHQRAILAPLASHARRSFGVPLAAGAERALALLADAPDVDDRWLKEIAMLAGPRQPRRSANHELAPVVVIVLRGAEPPA